MEGRKGIRQRKIKEKEQTLSRYLRKVNLLKHVKKLQRVKECKGVKDRLRIYYNSLINNVLDGGAYET
jgi:hypothetical protein